MKILDYNEDSGLFKWREYRNGINRRAKNNAGSLSRYGYIEIRIDGVLHKAHRLAWLYVYGYMPEEKIDHINRIRCDNRIINLRIATSRQNAYNSLLMKNNKSGYKGVAWDSNRSLWKAYASINGEHIHLGRFKKKEDAISARAAFVINHYDREFYFSKD